MSYFVCVFVLFLPCWFAEGAAAEGGAAAGGTQHTHPDPPAHPTPPVLYTHLCEPRVYQIVASTRKRNHNLTWQLRAKILTEKGTMVLSNTMVTEEGTEAEQRAVASAHLEEMCRDAATIKKRKKRAPPAPRTTTGKGTEVATEDATFVECQKDR